MVLNYEETDINQCPGDRLLNAFSSTSLCDTTSNCLPLPYFGLKPGGYECECMSGFSYPFDIQGPYKGIELFNRASSSPLCDRSEGLLQYPNWISRNFVENQVYTQDISSFNHNFKRDLNSVKKKLQKINRSKRFIDRRNNFEKLRDSIFIDENYFDRRCASLSFQDVVFLNDDDERFILNLRFI